ncbi:MAG: hypothetical protein JKY40_10520 [Gammaproteobacteria bacterium]|nr:hypothetical protein [Gammaproteobacteria bacterium]
MQCRFNSADWRHFGRLAGFTNRKTLHIDELGKSPYVLLQEYKGTQIANGQELVRRALKWHEDYTAEKNKSDGLLVISTHPPSKDALKYFESVYASLEARFGKPLKNRPGNVFGESEADFVVCLKMLQAGYDRETVASTLLACSPNLDTRKKGHINNYIKLTLDATGKMFV